MNNKSTFLERIVFELEGDKNHLYLTNCQNSAIYYEQGIKEIVSKKTEHRRDIKETLIGNVLKELRDKYPMEFIYKERFIFRKVNEKAYGVSGIGLMCKGIGNDFFDIFDFASRTEFFDSFEAIKQYFNRKFQSISQYQALDSGSYSVLLPAGISGIIAHECAGHVFESDLRFEEDYGEEISHNELSVIDDGNIKYMGYMPIDDEANIAKKTYTIKNGKINSYLTNETMAEKYQISNNCHARVTKPGEQIMVRMTNTYIEPTNHPIKLSKEYVWVKTVRDSEIDQNLLVIYPEKCYYCYSGKAVPVLIKKICLDIVETLMNISSIGNNLKFHSSVFGGCIKNSTELLPVAEGGPDLLINNMYCYTEFGI